MEKIASIRAIYIVSTRHVTDLTETVCVMANLVRSFYLLRFGLIDITIFFIMLLLFKTMQIESRVLGRMV